eukprot:CAMPEP_0115840082 /NCGR_PEP_ID=MMETSP0287-20121206/6587_1 /TAXON_ID=412157 /ORGANISM="Chrysochromulina rotalis, Strain UIO044" /LENGTH=279 /DNA_ID=CAMNT_0003293681 /DNA_START=421 /DNA_END=1258 /DNA_ORIENTATION=+
MNGCRRCNAHATAGSESVAAEAHGSFFLEDHKLLFCVNAKAGTNAWMKVLLRLHGDKAWTQPYPVTVGGKGRTLRLPTANNSQFRHALQDQSGYTRIAIVRDPARRLYSTWMDKLHLGHDSRIQNSIVSNQIHVPVHNFSRLTFEDFVEHVEDTIDSPSASDDNQHWRLQSDLCGLKHYGHLFTIYLGAEERGPEQQMQLECVLHEIAQRSPKPALVLSMNDSWAYTQAGTVAKDPHATPHDDTAYSPELISRVRHIYAKDYEAFFDNRSACASHLLYL